MVNCFYNKFSINVLAIILALLIMFGISAVIERLEIFSNINNSNINSMMSLNVSNNSNQNQENNSSSNEKNSNDLINKENNKILKEINEDEIINKKKWYLQIDKIGLIAEISEGTDEKILDEFIGHFSETPVNVGNVGLAAHNRGYKNNYFSRLKELEIGDKINYYINGHKFEYEVIDILIIYETDWSMLKNTSDNRITMITCIENREKYRLCVQAVRVKEELL